MEDIGAMNNYSVFPLAIGASPPFVFELEVWCGKCLKMRKIETVFLREIITDKIWAERCKQCGTVHIRRRV